MWIIRSIAVGSFLALAACGGGGGAGVSSTPTPPAGGNGEGTAPAPTNATITDLRANQTFSSRASTTNVTLSTPNGIVSTTAGVQNSLQLSYDAAAKSYTVTVGARTQTFGLSDAQAQTAPGETRYRRDSDTLTLVTTPYYSSLASNRYVGLGYFQHNERSGDQQITEFSAFTYGLLATDPSVPKAGSANWKTDIFGLLTTPQQQLRTIQGSGSFNVDFARGIFSAFANVDETDFITGGGRVGSLPVNASGQLTSGNGFRGDLSYGGGAAGPVAGTIAGQFYGPAAEEIGASFLAIGTGGVLTGALTGQLDTSSPGQNTSLLDVRSTERLSGTLANFFTQQLDGQSGYRDVQASSGNTGLITVTPQGVGLTSPVSYGYTPTAGDRVDDGRVNFTTYRTTIDGGPTEISYYRVGTSNTELQLTYLSFATWTRTEKDMIAAGTLTNVRRYYIPYGFATPRGLLAARTGTANYVGVVHGTGASLTGPVYDIGGTAQFAVDFSNARYSGSLALNGQAAGTAIRDLGTFGFGGVVSEGLLGEAAINDGGFGSRISPVLYGPGGKEIGAPFSVNYRGGVTDPNGLAITGVALAKQQ